MPGHVYPSGQSARRLPRAWQPSTFGPSRDLPIDVLQCLESVFAASLAGVEIHVSPAAREIGAKAFTMGEKIYFAEGQYDPGSSRGLRLLAHEMAHVAQQRSGRVHHPFIDGTAIVHDARLEAEAERMALRVVQSSALQFGQRPAPQVRGAAAQAMMVPVMSLTQQQIIATGSVERKSYDIKHEQIEPIKKKMKPWNRRVPTPKEFVDATKTLFGARSSDAALTQIDTLLARFHDAGDPDEMAVHAKNLILACNFWLRKVNVKTAKKKPLDYTNLGQLGSSTKLSGKEGRRIGILALQLSLTNWLSDRKKPFTLEQIVDSMTRENRGVRVGHGYVDVHQWNKKHSSRIPENIKTKSLRSALSSSFDPDNYLVSLDDDSQKRLAKLVFRGGKAYRWSHLLKDTGYSLFHTGGGGAHFVMDKRGRIYAGTLTTSPYFVHASLVGWADALSAGFIYASQGVVTKVKNDSGHYHPRAQEMVNVLLRLQLYGVDLKQVKVERMSGTHRKGGKTFDALDLLDSEHGEWPDEWEDLGSLF